MEHDLGHEGARPATVGMMLQGIIDGADDRLGIAAAPTGFHPLDFSLEGGFLPHELVLLGGLPGAGKTLTALQWARSFAAAGRTVTFLTYELDRLTLLSRLLVQELAAVTDLLDSTSQIATRRAVADMMLGVKSLDATVGAHPEVKEAMESLHAAAGDLSVIQASTQTTGAKAVQGITENTLEPGGVLIVDYLQKVPVFGAASLKDQIHRVAESLKEVAVSQDVTVVALAAVSEGNIGTRRLRLSDLRGSDSLAHECDIAMILNEKATATSDRHTAFDLTKLADARERVLISIEKNRRGSNDVHLEFEKDFANLRLKPSGQFVTEALAEGESVAG